MICNQLFVLFFRRVLMLGDTAVGKSSLVSQFMTSEYLHAYDTSIGKFEYNRPIRWWSFVYVFWISIL